MCIRSTEASRGETAGKWARDLGVGNTRGDSGSRMSLRSSEGVLGWYGKTWPFFDELAEALTWHDVSE
jgi:hypothetical protein